MSWNSPTVLPHGGIAHGHDEVGGFFKRLADKWEDFRVELRDLVSSGDHVCVIGWATGKRNGLPTAYGFVHVLTVADEVVTPSTNMSIPSRPSTPAENARTASVMLPLRAPPVDPEAHQAALAKANR